MLLLYPNYFLHLLKLLKINYVSNKENSRESHWTSKGA